MIIKILCKILMSRSEFNLVGIKSKILNNFLSSHNANKRRKKLNLEKKVNYCLNKIKGGRIIFF